MQFRKFSFVKSGFVNSVSLWFFVNTGSLWQRQGSVAKARDAAIKVRLGDWKPGDAMSKRPAEHWRVVANVMWTHSISLGSCLKPVGIITA